ncbi:MAG: DNA-3-methyladenine glycosylase family protein, partial [Candidatus Dormibacteria bacterium]
LPVLHLDPLAALIGFVSAQQVNLAFACSVRREVLLRFGQRLELGEDFVMVPDAERLARAAGDQLAGLRLTRAKARCLVALAQATVLGELEPGVLDELEDAEVERRLTDLPGVGPWTARQFLGRVLGRPVLVAGDLGVRRAVRVAYGLAQDPSIAEVEALTAHYGGAALAAQQLLLYHLTQVPAGAGVGSVSSPAWPAPEDPAAPAS